MTGKGTMLRALLESGCTKSKVQIKFTLTETQTRLNDKDCCPYEIYGGHSTANSVTMIACRLVEIN